MVAVFSLNYTVQGIPICISHELCSTALYILLYASERFRDDIDGEYGDDI